MTISPAPVYSSRGKLGLIVPFTNTVNEAEWAKYLPQGVTLHTTRMALHGPTAPDGYTGLASDISTKVRELMPAEVGAIAYACTADSMVIPPMSLVDDITTATKARFVTTASAIASALTLLGAKRISIATPFGQKLSPKEEAFFAFLGIKVLNLAGLGVELTDHLRVPTTPLDVLEAHCHKTLAAGSDVLLITCTDLPTFPLIARLERELSVPVVTSNQATLWATLRAARYDVAMPDLGRLMQSR